MSSSELPRRAHLRIGDLKFSVDIDKPTANRAVFESAAPPTMESRPLSECERDIIDVMRATGQRLTRPKVLDALQAAGKIHGESTVGRALAYLVKRQLISADRHKAGYLLVETHGTK